MHNLYLSPLRLVALVLLTIATWLSARTLEKSKSGDLSLPKIEFSQLEEIPTEDVSSSSLEITKEKEPLVTEKDATQTNASWNSVSIKTNGENRKYGNLVAMQSFLYLSDFANVDFLEKRIEEMLQAGKAQNIYDRKTVIVFPENIGTGLVLLEEKQPAFETQNHKELLQYLQRKYKDQLSQFPPKPGSQEPIWESIFRMKSERMAKAYTTIFSKMAKSFNVPILAGSIVLPGPKIQRGEVTADPKGPLYQIAVGFGPDGRPMEPMVKKTVLNSFEELLVEKGDINQNRIWVIPGWKVAIFLGEEVFSEPLYDRLKGKPLDGIVSPAFSAPNSTSERFQRYINEPISSVSEPEIWKKQGILKYIQRTRAQDLIQVFGKGSFWGQNTKMRTFNIRDFTFQDETNSDTSPQILNLYF